MDIFFIASKLGWFILTPSNFLLALALAGLVMARMLPARPALGLRIAGAGALGLALLAFTPLPNAMMALLERRFPPITSDTEIAGVVLLGGGLASHMTPWGYMPDLGEAADRAREAARLARLFPRARVLVSAGLVAPRPGEPAEATELATLLTEMGVARARIEIESASRTTGENATLSFRLAQPAPGETWALVTSASHMPRAVGTFRHAGFSVVAAPTDWRSDSGHALPSAGANLALADTAAKEYLGLFAYWISGRSAALLPSPRKAAPPRPPAAALTAPPAPIGGSHDADSSAMSDAAPEPSQPR